MVCMSYALPHGRALHRVHAIAHDVKAHQTRHRIRRKVPDDRQLSRRHWHRDAGLVGAGLVDSEEERRVGVLFHRECLAHLALVLSALVRVVEQLKALHGQVFVQQVACLRRLERKHHFRRPVVQTLAKALASRAPARDRRELHKNDAFPLNVDAPAGGGPPCRPNQAHLHCRLALVHAELGVRLGVRGGRDARGIVLVCTWRGGQLPAARRGAPERCRRRRQRVASRR
mmetsp:Transcript_4223/g.12148  ORF Transcript_4223/g.12148 Transcript_4223/m.12148 type:complete len:229 (+) Transcript_4223:615-1301(+)